MRRSIWRKIGKGGIGKENEPHKRKTKAPAPLQRRGGFETCGAVGGGEKPPAQGSRKSAICPVFGFSSRGRQCAGPAGSAGRRNPVFAARTQDSCQAKGLWGDWNSERLAFTTRLTKWIISSLLVLVISFHDNVHQSVGQMGIHHFKFRFVGLRAALAASRQCCPPWPDAIMRIRIVELVFPRISTLVRRPDSARPYRRWLRASAVTSNELT